MLKSIQNKIDGQRMGGRNLLIGQLMITCCSCLMARVIGTGTLCTLFRVEEPVLVISLIIIPEI